MASQTKVDSAGRTAERRAEGVSASYAANTSASGTFAAGSGASRVARADQLVADEDAGDVAVGDGDSEPEAASGQSHVAAARASSIEELSARPARDSVALENDEEVSIDELLISDSDDDEEDEATEVHPGLSEAVLAESLRGPLPAMAPREASSALPSEPESPEPELVETAAVAEQAVEEEAIEEPPPTEDEPGLSVALAAEEDREAPLAEAASEPVVDEEQSEPEGVSLADALEPAPESEAMEVSPESEAASASERVEDTPSETEAVLDPDADAAVEADSAMSAALEVEEPAVAAELELEDTGEPPPAAAAPVPSERATVPEALAAKRRDAPLPSFDIPDLESLSQKAVSVAARVPPRPVPLPPLSEIDEDDDDDDAVTHMGLPTVPEAANDFPAGSGFQVADPHVAALQSIDADISQGNSRRATTRVIPRVDPRSLPAKPRVHAPSGPPLSERLGALLRNAWGRVASLTQSDAGAPALDPELSPTRQRVNWMFENVLPPLSLVLFGSGLGAGVIMLVEADRSADAAAPMQAQAVQALQESPAPKGPLTLVDRARAGDAEALYKIANLPHAERTSSLTLALEAGYQAQKLREFKEFAAAAGPASASLPAVSLTRMVEYATTPETMLQAFQELTQWAGPTGPDVLYAVWEKAAGGSRAASLAQQLLYSADQRAKATPALLVALDLRSAANCDDYLRVLPSVVRDGDQRSMATLRALRHNDGCGADGQQDCYACLRNSPLLENALKAIESR